MLHNKILIMDATLIFRRNFHACNKGITKTISEPIKNEDGTLKVAGVYEQSESVVINSFLQSLLKIIKDNNYDYKVVCLFDKGSWRYRPKSKFTDYKSDRVYDNTYQTCWDAINNVIPLLRSIGITTIQVDGLEADDLGYYYSNNSTNSIIYSYDEDWHQSITPTNTIYKANTKTSFTYSDLIKEHITEPRDFAITKAINGGHDNLKSVTEWSDVVLSDCFDSTNLMLNRINAYKNRRLPQDKLDAIDYNMHLSRLDRIMHDEEVHIAIDSQESVTAKSLSKLDIIVALKNLENYPPYFLGVLSKYCSIHT